MRKTLLAFMLVALTIALIAPAAAHAGYRPLSKPAAKKATLDDLKDRGFTRITVQGAGDRVATIRVSKSYVDSWVWNSTKTVRMYPNNAIVIVTTRFSSDKAELKYRLAYWTKKLKAPSWSVDKGMHVAKGESTYSRKLHHGDYAGIFSMDSGWDKSVKRRQDINWAARRFVKACKDGSAKQHWIATW